MKYAVAALSTSLVAFAAAPVAAQEGEADTAAEQAAAEEARVWDTSAELGMIVTSGNTETTTVQGKIDATQDLENWKNRYVLSTLFQEDEITRDDGTTETEKTAEKVSGSIKSAYKLGSDHANLFVVASHTDDKFGAYRKYTTLSAGYGDRLLDTDTMQLDAEIGPGYYWAEQELATGETEKTDGALLVRALAEYDWQVTATTDFQQVLSVEHADENTRVNSDTSLSLQINGSLQMKIGYSIQRDSDVTDDKENTDTTTYANLVYKF